MTDTLRERLARAKAARRGFDPDELMQPLMAGVFGEARCRWQDFLDDADADLATVTCWALEPAQVERAAQAMYLREPPIDEPPHCTDQEDARAAIAALFEHRKDAMR